MFNMNISPMLASANYCYSMIADTNRCSHGLDNTKTNADNLQNVLHLCQYDLLQDINVFEILGKIQDFFRSKVNHSQESYHLVFERTNKYNIYLAEENNI